MSRRPTATTASRTGLSKIPSSASSAMPPPKVPSQRSTSGMSSSASSTFGQRQAQSAQANEDASHPPTPRKSSVVRRPGATVAASRGPQTNENGEINIQVVVRCRGRSPQELASSSPIITTTTGPLGKSITVETTPMASSSLATFTTASAYGGSNAPSTKTYPFDKVFGPEADQDMIFNEVADGMLDEVLSGYNCTIFAYGQTGTGKTYTMQGDLELSPLSAPSDSAGIVPRVLHRLFSLLEAAENTEFSVKCSYVELYNEELRDLLSTDYGNGLTSQANGTGLKLYEDGKKGTMIQGLEEVGVKSLKDALNVVNKGCQKRQVAETKMNTESSRSHTILSITVHVKEQGVAHGGEDLLKVGKFNLVDLAGSEAIGRSGATDKRAREAGMINQSLLTLGRVISALVEKGPHIPYRESKLTRLLQDSLGGKTKTCIVATVSPTRSNMEETLSTLDYAIRAKSIRNRPEVNQHLTKTGLLKEYLGDIERLKAEVLAAREKNGIYIPEEQWKEMQDDLAKQKSDYEEAKLRANSASVELATKKKAFDELSHKMLATTEELEQAREAERQLTTLMAEIKVELEQNRARLEEEKTVAAAYEKGEARLDRVATGLRSVATESVSDVGGLFEKLARKAKVLGSNADAATRFGADLQGLSTDLREGLKRMHAVQGELGRQLESEMSVHAQKGQEISQRDLAALEESFGSFNQLATSLTQSIESGKAEVASTNAALLKTRDKVHQSVREWAGAIGKRSAAMVDDVIEHQQGHLDMVRSVLDSTADLVDAVISTARDHLAAEAQAAQQAKQLTLDTANAEMDRLRAQNAMLAQMLIDEKAKTSRLRTELVQNLTSMIVDFTDTQDASWTAAVAGVQSANETSVKDMGAFASKAEEGFVHTAQRSEELGSELAVAQSTVAKQRDAGQAALGEVTTGVRSRLQEFGKVTGTEVAARVKSLDKALHKMGSGLAEASSSADARSKAQEESLAAMVRGVEQTHSSSLERTTAMCEDISTLTTALLSTHASTSQTFDASSAAATSTLGSLVERTERFLAEEIQEDVPTGITPKKKNYNVPTSWERTEPREALIAAMRRKAGGQVVADASLESIVGEGVDTRAASPEASIPPSKNNSSTSLASDVENHTSKMPTMMRQPSKLDLSKSQLRKASGDNEGPKVSLAVLGEGGANIPRRTRRAA